MPKLWCKDQFVVLILHFYIGKQIVKHFKSQWLHYDHSEGSLSPWKEKRYGKYSRIVVCELSSDIFIKSCEKGRKCFESN